MIQHSIRSTTGRYLLLVLFFITLLVIGTIFGLGYGQFIVLGFVLSLVAIIGLVAPVWVISSFYPAIHVLGQVPVAFANITISLERILLLFAGIGLIFYTLTKRQKFILPPSSLWMGWALWFLTLVISLLLFPSQDGLSQIASYLQKIVFAWIVFIAFVSINQKVLQRSLHLYVLVAVLASFVTIYVFLSESSLSAIRMGAYNLSGNLSNYLKYGLARAGAGGTMAAWLALFEISISKTRKERFLWTFIMVWLLLISTLALRREFLITIPVCIIVAILHRPTNLQSKGLILGLIVVILIFGVISQSSDWRDRIFVETVDAFQRGEDPRLLLTIASYQAWLKSPWIGYGVGNFSNALIKKTNASLPISNLDPEQITSHNSFSNGAVEGGILALMGIVWAMVSLLFRLVKSSTSSLMVYEFKVVRFGVVIWTQLLFWLIFGDALILNVFWFWIGFLMAMIYRTEHFEDNKVLSG